MKLLEVLKSFFFPGSLVLASSPYLDQIKERAVGIVP